MCRKRAKTCPFILKLIWHWVKMKLIFLMKINNYLCVLPPQFIPGIDSRASAACKPQGNQPFTILKISWNSKRDQNMAIYLFFFKFKQSNGFKCIDQSRLPSPYLYLILDSCRYTMHRHTMLHIDYAYQIKVVKCLMV